MNLWIKISSLIIVGFLILGIYYTLKIMFLPIGTPFWIVLLPFTWIFMIIFYSPVFYYGWVKKPKNKEIKNGMKFWAKALTVIFPVFTLIGFISPWGLDFPKDILFILPAFAIIGPLYYYAWKK